MTSRSLPAFPRRSIRSNTVFLAFLLGGMVPNWAVARQATVAVTGSVTDTFATSLPLADVLVHVVGTELTSRTDARGRFRLAGLVPGEYTLELNRFGYRSRTLRVTVSEGERGDIDVGSVVMRRSTGSTVTVSGVVLDEGTGAPVPSVPIRVNGRLVAVTDSGGSFHAITNVMERGGTNRMVLQRIGYTKTELEFVAPQSRDTLDFTILLRPAPVRLSDIGVDADVVPLTTGRMTERCRQPRSSLTRLRLTVRSATAALPIPTGPYHPATQPGGQTGPCRSAPHSTVGRRFFYFTVLPSAHLPACPSAHPTRASAPPRDPSGRLGPQGTDQSPRL